MTERKELWIAACVLILAAATGFHHRIDTWEISGTASQQEGAAEASGPARGVVVVEVSPHSALGKAGLQAGDVLLGWERRAEPPANPEAAHGLFDSPFDWLWLEIEQAPRGTVLLSGERAGDARTWTIEPGLWGAKVRPSMPAYLLASYLQAREEIGTGKIEDGIEPWRWAAEVADKSDDWRLRCWILLRMGEIWSEQRDWTRAQSAYNAALEQAKEPKARVAVWDAVGKLSEQQQESELAQEAYRSALEIREASGATSLSVARSQDHLGRAADNRGDLAEAESLFQRAFEIREKLAPNSLELAESYNNLGNVAHVRGHLEAAEAYYQRALTIREKLAPETLDLAESLHGLATIARRRGHLEVAETYHRRALKIRENLAPYSLELAESVNSLGTVAWRRGDLDTAELRYRRAFDIREKLAPQSLDLASSFNNLGIIAVERGNLAVAEAYFRNALEIREKLAPDTVAVSLDNLGTVARNRGDLATAEACHRRAMELIEELSPNSLYLASSLNNLGNVAWARSDLATAKAYYQKALEIRERLAPDSHSLAESFNNLGAVAAYQGDLSGAEAYHRRAMSIWEKLAPRSLHVASSFNNLGHVAWTRRDLAAAESYFKRAADIEKESAPNSLSLALTFENLGHVAQDKGKLAEAAAHYQQALEITEALAPMSTTEANVIHAMGNLYRKRRQPQSAATYLIRALNVLERQAGRLGGSHDRRGNFRALHRKKYRDAMEILLELNRPGEAFYALERSRARSFLEMLAERDIVFRRDLSDDMETRRRSIAVRYDRIQRNIAHASNEGDQKRIRTLLKEREELYRDRDEVIDEIRRTSPELASMQYPEALDFRTTQANLDAGTVVLSYSVGERSTEIFAIASSGDLRVESVSTNESELRGQLRDFSQLIMAARTGDGSGAHEQLRLLGKHLYGQLIDPVADVIDRSERILIVPDGPLHFLPWSVLIRDEAENAENRGRNWHYLVEWKPLHTALSTTVYAELKRRRVGREDEAKPAPLLAALGGAKYAGDDNRFSDFRVRSAVNRSLFAEWEDLPHTRREVERIAAQFPPAARRTYLGAAATEEAVKALGHEPRIVHLASHGHLDDHFPLDSALVLTMPEDPGADRDNGFLQVWEIFEQVRLDADLVVLSACASALGEEQSGEGLIGITRAFQYAGARSVVASLWNVQDRATAELMVRFYRHLRNGQTKDQALREAQLELIRGPIEVRDENRKPKAEDYSAPYYWAAFQIYGDWI